MYVKPNKSLNDSNAPLKVNKIGQSAKEEFKGFDKDLIHETST